jgi:ribonuclease-3
VCVYSDLEINLGYKFKDEKFIKVALMHSSYANEMKGKCISNERLEFLGDAVLGVIVSDYIFKNCPTLPEGSLTKLRSSLVCENALFKFSKQIHVGDFLKMSHGERKNKGNERPSILADAFEAIVAAIYLDGGLEEARKFILRFVTPELVDTNLNHLNDYKSMLQEKVQRKYDSDIEYVPIKEEGPDHNKKFWVAVKVGEYALGMGCGKSKKEAEQDAAKNALNYGMKDCDMKDILKK